jgi:hypothetical protein
MFSKTLRVMTVGAVVALTGAGNPAMAHFLFDPCCCYCCPAPVRVQACYQTIPVTEYREVRQTVQKPVVETTYVDQPVTEYRQVVENKTAEVPTVCYKPVTEFHTVQRDCGRWVTQYHQRAKVHPCQYDPRPDLLGFLNRTGYSVRMAFTPDFYADRNYVPNVVTQQIPVTRQVAVHGTQTVNFQVAKMVPYTTTRKVAVNSVRMVPQEVVYRQPVTVYKTVPAGSAYAWGAPLGGTATALQPVPDRGPATAVHPREKRRASRDAVSPPKPEALNDNADKFDSRETDDDAVKTPQSDSKGASHKSLKVPASNGAGAAEAGILVVSGSSEWKPTRRPADRWTAHKPRPSGGPAFPEITLASTDESGK